jgi:hypothetical protein
MNMNTNLPIEETSSTSPSFVSSTQTSPVPQAQTAPSPLTEWAKEHKVKKNEGNNIATRVARTVGFVALAILASPFLILPALGAGAFKLGAWAREKYKLIVKKDPILTSIRQMKVAEETDKFVTMQKVLKDKRFSSIEGLVVNGREIPDKATELQKGLKTKLTNSKAVKEIRHQKTIRQIMRQLSRQGSLTPEVIKELNSFHIVAILKKIEESQGLEKWDALNELSQKATFFNVREIVWDKVSKKVDKEMIPTQQVDRDVVEFQKHITHLLKILQKQDLSHPGTLNQEFIAELRKALNHPVYQALKEDASDPAVHLLQRFASDMWNKAPSVETYTQVGETLIKKAKEAKGKVRSEAAEESKTDQPMTGADLAKSLRDSHDLVAKAHWTDSGIGKVTYGITHVLQLLGAMASEGGIMRQIPAALGRGEYDSHGTLSNNPSLQGTTTIAWEDQAKQTHNGTINACFGGSPTIGDHKISPEFEAVLQAAENQQFIPEDQRDKEIPMMVNYNNLQNLDKEHGEGPRSRTLMLLNKKYPLSFRGMTLSKDSELYTMVEKVDGKEVEKIEWESPNQFGNKMMEQLMRSFNPADKGHGFYFHGSSDHWKPIFEAATNSATAFFEELIAKNPEEYGQNTKEVRAKLQGAYQEYVYSMIKAVSEWESLKILSERGIKDPKIMVISACKEQIDRGAMDNTLTMFLRFAEYKTLMGVMHSRALSARDRVILKKRMPQVLAAIEVIDREKFKAQLMDFFNRLDPNSSVDKESYAYTVAKKEPVTPPSSRREAAVTA